VDKDNPSHPGVDTPTIIPLPIIIDRGQVPPISYANAVQIQVAATEMFLVWGCVTPPSGDISQMKEVHAEYVARLAIPPSLLDGLVAQLETVRATYRSIQQAVAEAARQGGGGTP